MVFGNFKVEISLHTTTVYVSRHGIPYTSRSKFRHTHLQLAGRKHLIHQHFIDVTMIGPFQRTHLGNDCIGFRHFAVRIVAVCSQRVEVELSRMGSVLTFKGHLTITRTQIKGFFIIKFKYRITCFYNTGTSHIEDTHFTAGQEERSFQRINRFKLQHLTNRKRATYHHTVVHGIHHIYFIGDKYLFD